MKRIITLVLLFVLTFNIVGIGVFAEDAQKNEAEIYNISPMEIEVDCNSALLMDAVSGRILYSKNENESASPASVTKIMTLLLVMEAIESGAVSLMEKVTVSANAAGMGGSQVFLEEGEQMTVEELIKCAVIASGNDAAVALAEHIAGGEEAFVKKMNGRAVELGLKNTNFENATGLDDTTVNHISSALDIAIMSRELIKYPIITEYSSIWQDTIRNGEFTLTNTNRLVRYYEGCNGLKTGSTDKAGYCVSATAKRGDMQLIAVVMGAPTRDVRNEIARKMLDFGFAGYGVYTKEVCELEKIPIFGGVSSDVICYSTAFCALVNKADAKRVELRYEIPESITAPIMKDDIVGKVKYMIDGKLLGESEIRVKESVDKISFLDVLKSIILSHVGCR